MINNNMDQTMYLYTRLGLKLSKRKYRWYNNFTFWSLFLALNRLDGTEAEQRMEPVTVSIY